MFFVKSAAVLSTGELYIWGRMLGGFGGRMDDVLVPVVAAAFDEYRIKAVACGGDSHTLVLTSDGLLFSLGDIDYNKWGMLIFFYYLSRYAGGKK